MSTYVMIDFLLQEVFKQNIEREFFRVQKAFFPTNLRFLISHDFTGVVISGIQVVFRPAFEQLDWPTNPGILMM